LRCPVNSGAAVKLTTTALEEMRETGCSRPIGWAEALPVPIHESAGRIDKWLALRQPPLQ